MESTIYTVAGKEFDLQHHGIKGMKWGVRRYRNKNGSGTASGEKSNGTPSNAERSNKNGRTAKRVAAALLASASIGVAVAAYRKNPAKVNDILAKVGKSTIDGAKKAGSKTYNMGKKYAKEAFDSAKQGLKEGVKNAPKKAAEAVVTGVTMMTAKRMLDSVVGKEEAARIFQANNKKKIGSFWKVSQEDRNDDD